MAKQKALPFTIPKVSSAAIIVQQDRESRFYSKLHQHTEVQLSYIITGSGTLFAGNSILPFNPNSLVVLGSNLPHLFESNSEANQESHRISIFIDPDWLAQLITHNPELNSLTNLVANTSTGFVINVIPDAVGSLFRKVLKTKDVNRFIHFVTLLNQIKKLKYTPIARQDHLKPYSETDEKRMRRLLDYTLSNYPNTITITHAALQTALTPAAFCKYFKKRTGKTYIEFLNQVRVEASCRTLLEQPDMSIATIAYRNGFSSLSNFNRQFKAIKKTTPRAYRKLIAG